MEERRSRVGLLREQRVECRLLVGGAGEDEGHAANRCIAGHGAEVVCESDVRVQRAGKGDGGGKLDRTADAGGGSLGARRKSGENRGETEEISEPETRRHDVGLSGECMSSRWLVSHGSRDGNWGKGLSAAGEELVRSPDVRL
jgi:hypothetical protein